MKLSIFARLVISYLMLFCILAGISLYFIYHIDQFNKVIRSIVSNDTFVLEFSNRLSDVLLSEYRYDRKYLLLKDEVLYQSSLKAGNEFNELLQGALLQTNSGKIKKFLIDTDTKHKIFMDLVKKERELLKSGTIYPSAIYLEKKKLISESLIEQLKKIRQSSEQAALVKVVALDKSGDKVKTISIIISVIAVSIGLLVAFFITRSIKQPLDIMRAKTVEIAQANFERNLNITSPPEIAELASALNIMCHKLQEVDDLKSDFFSHMSHELRTPLTSIKVGTEMLLEGLGGELTQKQQHIMSIVAKESDRLIELVNSLLDLSKMEAGMLEYQFKPTDLASLVKKALESLAPLIEEKKIAINNRIGNLQPVTVDQERILQVLRNIIGNAIKFNHINGEICIEATMKVNEIEVAVKDTGPGIPKRDLERIFMKFQQVISSKGESKKGTGIGLATVKQVILAHGGKVWATSQIGKGSTLHITLPLAA